MKTGTAKLSVFFIGFIFASFTAAYADELPAWYLAERHDADRSFMKCTNDQDRDSCFDTRQRYLNLLKEDAGDNENLCKDRASIAGIDLAMIKLSYSNGIDDLQAEANEYLRQVADNCSPKMRSGAVFMRRLMQGQSKVTIGAPGDTVDIYNSLEVWCQMPAVLNDAMSEYKSGMITRAEELAKVYNQPGFLELHGRYAATRYDSVQPNCGNGVPDPRMWRVRIDSGKYAGRTGLVLESSLNQ